MYRALDSREVSLAIPEGPHELIDASCGNCPDCIDRRVSDHSTRLAAESSLWLRSSSITGTYDDEHLPPLSSCSAADVLAFIKRVRRFAEYHGLPSPVRYDVVTEYSPAPLMRPHWHGAFFNFWPPDAREWSRSQSGAVEFVSETLTRLWGKGRITFQRASPGAFSYFAEHQASKLRGRAALGALRVFDQLGAFVGFREPERHLCSRHPGIGHDAVLKDLSSLQVVDAWVLRSGSKVAVPRYFDKVHKRVSPETFAAVVERRELESPERERRRLAGRTKARWAEDREVLRSARREHFRKRRDGVDRGRS